MQREVHPNAVPSPQPRVIGEEIHCLHCSYDLNGLSTDGVCPECGNPVNSTLSAGLLRLDRDLSSLRKQVNTIRTYAAIVAFASVALPLQIWGITLLVSGPAFVLCTPLWFAAWAGLFQRIPSFEPLVHPPRWPRSFSAVMALLALPSPFIALVFFRSDQLILVVAGMLAVLCVHRAATTARVEQLAARISPESNIARLRLRGRIIRTLGILYIFTFIAEWHLNLTPELPYISKFQRGTYIAAFVYFPVFSIVYWLITTTTLARMIKQAQHNRKSLLESNTPAPSLTS